MAITPRKIIDSAVGIGRSAVSAGAGLVGRLRRSEKPSAPPAAETSVAAGTRAAGTKTGRATPGKTRTARAKSSGAKTTPKRRTSGSPSTVGAAKPGEPGGHKSATAASGERPPAGATEPPPAKPTPPRERGTSERATASRAAAGSGDEVADAASRPDEKR
jgi:hypothetical protein